jgi:NADPH:quinone reductase-like Zn-dependent oxidoreductase
MAMPVPAGMPWAEAGGFPEVFLTAHDALFTQAGLAAGERLLVHGAAGGVGTAAVQLGRATGARVTASVRNPDLRHAVRSLGAQRAVAHDDFVDHGPYDVVLELVGAVNMVGNLESLATDGRIVVIGVGAGAAANLDLLTLMGKRARVMGSTLRFRPLEEKALVSRRAEAHVLPLLEDRRVRVLVEEVFPLDGVEAAYARFKEGGKLGKIVLITG